MLPWTDWQFLAVTAAALWAGRVLVLQLVPRRGSEADPCSGCASGSAACSRARTTDGHRDDTTRRASPLVVLDDRR